MSVPRVLLLAVVGASLLWVYRRFVRPGVVDWGSTIEERGQVMPGDEILPDAVLQTTRSITVDAPPGSIWPWLVQMGGGDRAGAYTYDWIERLLGIDIWNSDRILPEHQHLDKGQFLQLNAQGTGLVVRDLEVERYLVFQWEPATSTWTFALYPQADGTTRVVSRNRLISTGSPIWPLMAGIMEPASLVMERKMLFGIKERAERYALEQRTGAENVA